MTSESASQSITSGRTDDIPSSWDERATANFADDHEMLAHGMVMYDALYTWCRSLQSETHNWPAKIPAATQAAGA